MPDAEGNFKGISVPELPWPQSFWLVRGSPFQKPFLIDEGQLAVYDDGKVELQRYEAVSDA